MNYPTIASCIIWWLSEVVIAILRRSKPWRIGQDRLSYWAIWLSFLLSILAALALSKLCSIGRIAFLTPYIGYLGCLIIMAGTAIRWIAVVTLGRQFTLQVTTTKEDKLIENGIYRYIRHPGYLGNLLSLTGFGLAIENWASTLVLLLLPFAAILYRIHVEERALQQHFGLQYEEYCTRTKRLLPKLF